MLMADGSVSIDVRLVCEVVKLSKLFHWLPIILFYFKKLDLKTLKSSIMMFLVLMSLSPVLRTLTAATSSDSIWALAALLFILNALLADYTANVSDDEINEGYVSIYICLKFFIWSIYYRLSSVLSMNAAVSASVVLASRLSTNVSVFALVLFSILSFALFPILRRRLQVKLFPKKFASFSHWSLCSVSHHVRMRYGYWSQRDFGLRLFF